MISMHAHLFLSRVLSAGGGRGEASPPNGLPVIVHII